MATFSERVEEVTARVTSPATTMAAAAAMADTLRGVAARFGSMSRTGSAVVVKPATGGPGVAIVRTAGAYALADRGRGRPVRAYARWRSALATPWGPRANVAGSTWAGFGIGAAAEADVLEAGRQAFRDAVGVTP